MHRLDTNQTIPWSSVANRQAYTSPATAITAATGLSQIRLLYERALAKAHASTRQHKSSTRHAQHVTHTRLAIVAAAGSSSVVAVRDMVKRQVAADPELVVGEGFGSGYVWTLSLVPLLQDHHHQQQQQQQEPDGEDDIMMCATDESSDDAGDIQLPDLGTDDSDDGQLCRADGNCIEERDGIMLTADRARQLKRSRHESIGNTMAISDGESSDLESMHAIHSTESCLGEHHQQQQLAVKWQLGLKLQCKPAFARELSGHVGSLPTSIFQQMKDPPAQAACSATSYAASNPAMDMSSSILTAAKDMLLTIAAVKLSEAKSKYLGGQGGQLAAASNQKNFALYDSRVPAVSPAQLDQGHQLQCSSLLDVVAGVHVAVAGAEAELPCLAGSTAAPVMYVPHYLQYDAVTGTSAVIIKDVLPHVMLGWQPEVWTAMAPAGSLHWHCGFKLLTFE